MSKLAVILSMFFTLFLSAVANAQNIPEANTEILSTVVQEYRDRKERIDINVSRDRHGHLYAVIYTDIHGYAAYRISAADNEDMDPHSEIDAFLVRDASFACGESDFGETVYCNGHVRDSIVDLGTSANLVRISFRELKYEDFQRLRQIAMRILKKRP